MFSTSLRILSFSFAMVMAASGSSFAQTQAKPAAPAAPAQQAPAAAPVQPFRTEILNFENWTVTCREFAEGKRKKICLALLQIAQQNNNQSQVIFSWTIGFDDENHPMMTLQTPTGVAITPGIDLKLAKANRAIPYTACEAGHCIATLPFDAALAREVAGSADVQAVIHASDGRDVTINIPMKGFDKAYAALAK